MKKLSLPKGKFTLVDDEDFDYLSKKKWKISDSGRVYRTEIIYMHRELMKTPKGMVTDHVDRNPLNNQKSNLRVCTISQNAMNTQKKNTNFSGFKGVSWDKKQKKWLVRLNLNGKVMLRKRFKLLKDAANEYNKGAKQHFGEYAVLNEIG